MILKKRGRVAIAVLVIAYFHTVHHDLWDYDVAAQPTLTTVVRNGEEVPVVVQATKMGLIFVLHRETGEPLFPVEERPVPQDGVAGEVLSPTQPFPVKPPPLVPHTLSPDSAWGVTPWQRNECRELIESLRFDGIYTPPSLQGSIMYPGPGGGSNWGGVAVDPVRGVAVANVMDLPFEVRLFPADEYEREREANPDVEVSPQQGTPFGMARKTLVSSIEIPCSTPPQGTILAVDLATAEVKWEVPLGVTVTIGSLQFPMRIGAPTFGGPLITASGIVFIGGFDNHLHAVDIATAEELWAGWLPASGQATPMTYRLHENGRQFVVIAAGGHAKAGTMLGDSIVAFALPETRTVTPFESVRETLLYVGVAFIVAFVLARFGKHVFSKWLWFPLLAVFVIIATEAGWLMTQSVGAMVLSFGLALAAAYLLTRLRKYLLGKRPIEA